MRLFSLAEVADVTGVNPQTLRNWITGGLVRPARPGGTGPGNSHAFSDVQVLAVASAVRHRHEGASDERAVGVLVFLAGLTRERLDAYFLDGRTFPVPASLMKQASRAEGLPPGFWLPGDLIEPPDDPSLSPGTRDLIRQLDLKALDEEVKKRLTEQCDNPAKNRRKESDAASRDAARKT